MPLTRLWNSLYLILGWVKKTVHVSCPLSVVSCTSWLKKTTTKTEKQSKISNSNWTEWRTIPGSNRASNLKIGRAWSASTISHSLVRHDVQLLINYWNLDQFSNLKKSLGNFIWTKNLVAFSKSCKNCHMVIACESHGYPVAGVNHNWWLARYDDITRKFVALIQIVFN